MSTPVVLIVFNRPDTTQQVLEAIQQVQPRKLFVIADGPRQEVSADAEKCAATRKLLEAVEWDCELLTNFADTNMGLKRRVSTGLDWVFTQVDEATILEDDTVPHPSFFRFCQELLEQYRHDRRVTSITGTNLLGEWKSDMQSYHFSNYFNSWGWATWKRVWDNYDVDMRLWAEPEARSRVRDVIADDRQYGNRKRLLEATYQGKTKSWAYQFFFMSLLNSGLTITPAVNLVANVGFGQQATNTRSLAASQRRLSAQAMPFPLKAPIGLAVDRDHDYQRYKQVWERTLSKRIRWKLRALNQRLRGK
ncbi:MAG: glycosyltransferase family 2 protein [Leptolyngbya sp. SIO4C1]|nr:glycosyltransferase family 2 protein [Leptolyngbya sp. SIO4C1]